MKKTGIAFFIIFLLVSCKKAPKDLEVCNNPINKELLIGDWTDSKCGAPYSFYHIYNYDRAFWATKYYYLNIKCNELTMSYDGGRNHGGINKTVYTITVLNQDTLRFSNGEVFYRLKLDTIGHIESKINGISKIFKYNHTCLDVRGNFYNSSEHKISFSKEDIIENHWYFEINNVDFDTLFTMYQVPKKDFIVYYNYDYYDTIKNSNISLKIMNRNNFLVGEFEGLLFNKDGPDSLIITEGKIEIPLKRK